MPIYDDILATIGRTPIVKINKIPDDKCAYIYGKLEMFNPAGSVKDRIGLAMIEDAEKKGALKPGDTIVEPTSGNTGIALVMVATVRGYKTVFTMPETMSLERRALLRYFGAEIVLTEGPKGMKGAVEKAEELVKEKGYFQPQQFDNPANPEIHEQTTGPEIWQDTNGEIDVFVAGVGTGGTITGVSRYIKHTQGKAIISVAVEPSASPIITQTLNGEALTPAPHKIQGIGAGFVPNNLDLSIVDRVELVDNDESIAMAKRLMREEGIMCGISCGAAVVAAERLAELPEFADKKIVVILPDSGERYLSTALFAGEFSNNELVQ